MKTSQPNVHAQTKLVTMEEKKLKAAEDVSRVLAKNDCMSGSASDTTHITVTTSDNQSVTIDMPMQEPKRVTVREKSTVVEDRDFVYGDAVAPSSVSTSAAASDPKPTGSISTGSPKTAKSPTSNSVDKEDDLSNDSNDSDDEV